MSAWRLCFNPPSVLFGPPLHLLVVHESVTDDVIDDRFHKHELVAVPRVCGTWVHGALRLLLRAISRSVPR